MLSPSHSQKYDHRKLTFSGTTPLKSTNAVVILRARVSKKEGEGDARQIVHVKETVSEPLRILEIAISLQANPSHDLMWWPVEKVQPQFISSVS
jgi:hypothetical protein